MVDLKILGIGVYQDEGLPVLLLYLVGTERVLSIPLEAGDLFALSTALQSIEDKAHPALLNLENAIKLEETIQDLEDVAPNLVLGALSRPISANLTLKLVRILGGQILGVEISSVQKGEFITQLICSKGTSISRLGCHVVDGILLAVHGGVLLRCADELILEAERMQDVLNKFPEHIRHIIETALDITKEQKNQSVVQSKDTASQDFQAKHGVAGLAEISSLDGVKQLPKIEIKVVKMGAEQVKGGAGIASQSIGQLFATLDVAVGAIPAVVQASLWGGLENLQDSARQEGRWKALLKALTPETKALM